MSDAVFGQVEFFTHVSTVRDERGFEKKVKLHTVHCEYQDRFEVVGKFKTFADIHALPAYGRDYKSAQAVIADWKAGKDFLDFLEGHYFSIRDSRPEQVWVRYDKRTKLVRVQ